MILLNKTFVRTKFPKLPSSYGATQKSQPIRQPKRNIHIGHMNDQTFKVQLRLPLKVLHFQTTREHHPSRSLGLHQSTFMS